MNSAVSIHTHFLEEALKGAIDLHIMKIPGVSMYSLETELVSRGYSSMQNKLKHYLIRRQAAGSSVKEQITEPELTDQEAYRIIYEVSTMCAERAEARRDSPVGSALERYVSDRFEKRGRKTVYFYPRPEMNTGNLMPDAMAQVSQALYGTPDYNETQRRKLNTLLTQKARKQNSVRQDLIRAAYRLGMNLEETNEFLTKAAFTYGLDYANDWELRAAYLIACQPVEEDDSSLVFRSKMHTAVPTEQFLRQICRSEFIRWVKEYRRQCALGRKTAFLLEWAWKLMVYEDEQYARKSTYSKLSASKELEISQAFGRHVDRLEAIAAQLDQEPGFLQTDMALAGCMLRRQQHLLDFIYAAAGDPLECDVVLSCKSHSPIRESYAPPFKEYGFTRLPRPLQKIADPERPVSRSDIITLGLELGMTWEQLDQALEIGGFYKLYVKDLHEQALAAVLAAGFTDPERCRQAVLEQLQLRYGELSDALRQKMIKNEPEWIRRIKDAVSASRADH